MTETQALTPDPRYDEDHDSWKEDKKFPVKDWQYEVYNNDTRRGYDDWVCAKRAEEVDECWVNNKPKPQPHQKPKIAIAMEGGLIASVVTDTPELLGKFDICILDYDPAQDDEDMIPIDQGDGTTQNAYVRWEQLYTAEIVIPDYILPAQDYVTKSGAICPYCRSENLQSGPNTKTDGDYIITTVFCHDCHKTWQDVYRLVGYDLTE